MAFVTLKPHAADKWAGKGAEFETELKKYSRERLPGFARPEWVYVLRDLPVRPCWRFECID
jgi:acyl-coenzyme A synthetase/AMP-(fatty) acid ligase